ncbi:MAG: SMI1/KNR4 family protein [Myxococcota bacterium]
MTDLDQDMKKTVAELRDAMQEEHLREYDEDSPQELRPPATDEQIRKLAKRFGGRIPPSYEAFLRLHNGWMSFSGNAMLLPADEHDEPWVAERLAWFRKLLADDNEDDILDDSVVVMLGPDEPDFVVIDLSERSDDGECEVVHFDLKDGELSRSDDFVEFLEDTLAAVNEEEDENDEGEQDKDDDED